MHLTLSSPDLSDESHSFRREFELPRFAPLTLDRGPAPPAEACYIRILPVPADTLPPAIAERLNRISRLHAYLGYTTLLGAEFYAIRDLDSTNGTSLPASARRLTFTDGYRPIPFREENGARTGEFFLGGLPGRGARFILEVRP